MTKARRIYQDTIDCMTAAIVDRDPDAFLQVAHLPFDVRTVDGVMIQHTRAEVAQFMLGFAEQLTAQDIARYERTCDAARFVNADQITGYHTSRVWTAAGDALQPFLSRATLCRSGDTWQVALNETALRMADWALLPAWFGSQARPANIRPATDGDQRLFLFQLILDRISTAFLSGDSDAWLDCLSLPLQMVTRHGVNAFETPDAIRADFALYQREFEIHGITDIIREAKTAEVIDGDQMVGTYTTHILRGATHVVPPWDASMTLRCENGLWRVTTVMRAIGHLNWRAINPSDIEELPCDTPQKGETQ